MPLLVGIDGTRKMSKSLGNHIAITDAPAEIYGRTMRIPDDAIGEYARLLLDAGAPAPREGSDGARGATEIASGKTLSGLSARDAKRALARGLVSWLHSPQEAEAAERQFDRVHIEHSAPEEVEDATVRAENGVVHLPGVIASEFGLSRSEARRLIDEGGVALDAAAIARGEYDLPLERVDGALLRAGKRRFRRLHAA
jgi:tyrosyl-tRNA synthetase